MFALYSTRYLNPIIKIPKSVHFRNMIFQLPEKEFKQIARMQKKSFLSLVKLLETDCVCDNNSNNKQIDTWVQILVAIDRLGCFGNGSSVGRIARCFGISTGAVVLYTKRTIKARLNVSNSVMK
jgi:hypothetical protein